jgi:hypothetical protein
MAFALSTEKGMVKFTFPEPVNWFCLSPDDADHMAEMIKKWAAFCRTE